VIAVALAVGEVLTPGLVFLGPVALAAGAAALADLLGAGAVGSLIVFIVCSIASLAFLRPIARRHVRLPALSRTGTDALVGRKAVVTRKVDAVGGRIRVGGEEWSAARTSTADPGRGQTVDIVKSRARPRSSSRIGFDGCLGPLIVLRRDRRLRAGLARANGARDPQARAGVVGNSDAIAHALARPHDHRAVRRSGETAARSPRAIVVRPAAAITQDNLVVNIDTVIYFQSGSPGDVRIANP
jgi:membrane protein implicated in regulation of membrane protease activity